MYKFFIIIIFFLVAPLFADSYSINLMWINKNKYSNGEFKGQYIFYPGKYVFKEKHYGVDLKERFYEWALKNPKAQINIWFDSQFASEDQIENSKKLFNEWNEQLSREDAFKINLKDIRDIPLVRDKEKVFSDKIPVYFRADLLRFMATIDTLEKCVDKCFFVYADVDVTPLSKEELFTEDTIEKLNTFGIVMKKGGFQYSMENSFHIVANNKPNLIEAITTVIIDLNIKRAVNALKNSLVIPLETFGRSEYQPANLAQTVYSSIPTMFKYFYHLEGLGELKKNIDGKYIIFPSGKKISVRAFPTKSLRDFDWEFTPINDFIKNLSGIMIIPTKEVSAPPARGSGYD